jgi:hypothetical protein
MIRDDRAWRGSRHLETLERWMIFVVVDQSLLKGLEPHAKTTRRQGSRRRCSLWILPVKKSPRISWRILFMSGRGVHLSSGSMRIHLFESGSISTHLEPRCFLLRPPAKYLFDNSPERCMSCSRASSPKRSGKSATSAVSRVTAGPTWTRSLAPLGGDSCAIRDPFWLEKDQTGRWPRVCQLPWRFHAWIDRRDRNLSFCRPHHCNLDLV